MAAGNWNIGSFNLPEFRISEGIRELVGGITGTSPTSSSYGSIYNSTPKQSSQLQNNAYAPSNYSNLYKGVSGPSNINPDSMARDLEDQRQQQEEEARRELLNKVRRSYDPFFQELSRQESELPAIQSELLGNVNTGYQNQTDVINRGQQAGLAQANASADSARMEGKKSLRDLGLNLGSAVSAFGQKLGSVGAGDSSAARMANYGFTKMANRNTADVMGTVRENLAKIESVKQNIVTDAQDKLSALETWKSDQSVAISTYVRSLRDYIAKAKAQGKQALAQNEVDAIREGFNRAQERLQQINDLAVTAAYQIKQNAQAALADAQSFSTQMAGMGNVAIDPQTGLPIEQGTIEGTQQTAFVPGSYDTGEDKSITDLLNYA